MKVIDDTARRSIPATIAVMACALILLSACAQENDGSSSGPQAAERGEQLFNENCGFCHGAGGRGPKFAELKALSRDEQRQKISNHPMSGQIPQRLKAHELSDLYEFLESK